MTSLITFSILSIVAFLTIGNLIFKNKKQTENNEQLKNKISNMITYEQNKDIEHFKISFPIGTKIILLSNQPNMDGNNFDDIFIATVSGYDFLGKSNQAILLYTNDKTGTEHFTISHPYYYSIEMEKALLKLNWAERFTIYSKGNHTLDEEYKLRREKDMTEEKNQKSK